MTQGIPRALAFLPAMALAGVCACASTTAPSAVRPSPAHAEAAAAARGAIDFAAIEAWLGCAQTGRDLASCAGRSAATRGGRIATLAAATFGDATPPVRAPDPAAVAALVAQMKAWPDARSRAAAFLPGRVEGAPVLVFVVGNGHPWGDAYVREIDAGGEPLRLSQTGEPVILLNAVLIASGYRGSAAEQAARAFGVLSHEFFHALFRTYRARDPRWQRHSSNRSPAQALQRVVLDEGIAHFVDRQDQLAREGFPPERAAAALAALGRAMDRLSQLEAHSAEATELLGSANRGRYWDKFGSIAGMLFAYGVHRAFGLDGIRDAVRCGPGRLVSLYARAAQQLPDLPTLPDLLSPGSWFDLCNARARRVATHGVSRSPGPLRIPPRRSMSCGADRRSAAPADCRRWPTIKRASIER